MRFLLFLSTGLALGVSALPAEKSNNYINNNGNSHSQSNSNSDNGIHKNNRKTNNNGNNNGNNGNNVPGVLKATTWSQISISGNVGGRAAEDARNAFRAVPTDPATVSKEDLAFLSSINKLCNAAEVQYNDEIIKAGPGEQAAALGVGKTQNKILKQTAEKLALEAKRAQGLGQDTDAKLRDTQTRLDQSIRADQANRGLRSTKIAFDASTTNPPDVRENNETERRAAEVLSRSKSNNSNNNNNNNGGW